MLVTRMSVVVLASFGLLACASHSTFDEGGEGQGDAGRGDGGTRFEGGVTGSNDGGASKFEGGSYEQEAGPVATRPPPEISSVSPLSGDYGTVVTITGDNFDEASARLVLDGPAESVTLSMPQSGTQDVVVLKWTKTEIQFKYPFPADGPVRVTTTAGTAEGGTFVPSYKPGPALSGTFTRRELLSVVSPAAGTLVAAFDGQTGPQILVGKPDGTIEVKAYNRGTTALHTLSLYVTAANGVDGFYSDGSKLWQLANALTTPTTTATTVATTQAAGARDATGPYAWIRKSSTQFVRVRPPSWAESGAAVTDPTPASAPGPSIAVAVDHSFYVGWGVNDGGSFPLYDHTARPVVRRLRPGQATFDGTQGVGGGADDYMMWTRFRPGPDGRVASYYCASDTGFGSPSIDCGEGYVGNGTPVPSYSQATEYVIGHNATTAFAAVCDAATKTLKLGPEAQTAQQKPIIFPCPKHTVAVTVDPAGIGTLLVSTGKYVYHPRKR